MAIAPHFLTPLLKTPDGDLGLWVHGLALPVVTRLSGAFDSASRKRGLLGRTSLAEDEALVIAPCSAVHTFGMQFAIDLVYADRTGRVLKIRKSVPRNRVSAAWGAFAVIELAAGTVARTGIGLGSRLELQGTPSSSSDVP